MLRLCAAALCASLVSAAALADQAPAAKPPSDASPVKLLIGAPLGADRAKADADRLAALLTAQLKRPVTGVGSKEPVVPKANAQELFKTGMQAYVKGDAKTAVTLFRKALSANAGFATAWRALGFAYEKLGEWGQAKTAFQKYLQLTPNASDAAQIRERIGTP